MREYDELVSRLEKSACARIYPSTQVVVGRGSLSSRIVIIGEAPGAKEEELGLPFVGRSGALLEEMMGYAGINDYYITNVMKTRPPKNRNPTKEEVAVCRPFLEEQLRILDPEIIVLVGRFAMNFFFPKKKKVLEESGRLIDGTYYVIPHPSYFLRRGGTGWQKYLENLKKQVDTLKE
ncbi:MAG: uracil-DNA glycosylase [Candidatus Woesearchaeota archaeon]